METKKLSFIFGKLGLVLCSGLFLFLLACNKTPSRILSPPSSTSPTPTPDVETKFLQWSGALDVKNGEIFRNLLRDYGYCDQALLFSLLNAKCSNWNNNALLTLRFDKEELPSKVTFAFQPYVRLWTGRETHSTRLIQASGEAIFLNDYRGFYVKFEQSEYVSLNPGWHGSPIAYLIISSRYDNPLENRVLNISLYYGGSTDEASRLGTANLENLQKSDDTYPEDHIDSR